MPANTQTDSILVLTIDGTDYSCQVIDASFTMAAPGESTPIPVACGDTVSEPGDARNGSLTGSVLKDTSATGITRALAILAGSGAEVDYVYTEKDEADYEMSWSGKATVPAFAIDFAPSKMGRHNINLVLTTSVLAAAA